MEDSSWHLKVFYELFLNVLIVLSPSVLLCLTEKAALRPTL